MGRAFAQELAINGFNVVLHGRNQEKLARVMSELQDLFPQRLFRILIADASTVACANCLAAPAGGNPDAATVDFEAIKRVLSDINLTVLVNNVGGNPNRPAFLLLQDKEETKVTENVSLNALFPLHLIRALLPELIQNSPALLVTVGTLADQGLPLNASYSASKRFLMTLTSTLRLEMAMEGRENDVEILGIRTGRVTGVAGYKEPPSFFAPDVNTYAKSALALAGHGHGIVIGYWTHTLQYVMASMLPRFVEDKVLISIMRQNKEWELKKMKES
ncbi:NAD(P)-binding protein [Hypomontagnella monticulosa]|nr:NAD(P)-binding protein [Hypomontagnella monticulosa]